MEEENGSSSDRFLVVLVDGPAEEDSDTVSYRRLRDRVAGDAQSTARLDYSNSLFEVTISCYEVPLSVTEGR
jgi:hypothetical protein